MTPTPERCPLVRAVWRGFRDGWQQAAISPLGIALTFLFSVVLIHKGHPVLAVAIGLFVTVPLLIIRDRSRR